MNTRRPKSIVLFATITLTIFLIVTVILSGIDDGSMEILRYDDDAVEKRRINQDFRKCVTILNDSGGPWEHVDSLLRRLDEEVFEDPSLAVSIRDRMNREVENIKTHVQPWTPKDKIHRRKSVITVATIICGQSRRGQVINMLKSLLIFSMDATLHLVVFSDASTIVDAAQDVLSLRMVVQERFGSDFTFEIHLDQFPDNGGVPWKKMYRLCATQRLFFADLLPHIDSLIYIDTDMLILSNITDVWDHFKNHMVEKEFAASAMNNEDAAIGWYGPWLRIPYYGKRGINAGIMLMNLTRMRYFGFGQTSIAVQELYKSRILLADQDIANIIFATYPEYFSVLPCSFNFNWIHCGSNTYNCYNSMGENFCFCRAAVKDGIKIIHGNSNTFRSSYEGHSFLPQMYDAFNRFNMVKDDPRPTNCIFNSSIRSVRTKTLCATQLLYSVQEREKVSRQYTRLN